MKNIDIAEYTQYRTLTKLTAEELKKINGARKTEDQNTNKDKSEEENKNQQKTGMSGFPKVLLVLTGILAIASAVIELQKNTDSGNQTGTTNSTAQDNTVVQESSVQDSVVMDEKLAEIVSRMDELKQLYVSSEPEDLETLIAYSQDIIEYYNNEGYVEKSIQWAMIKLDLQNYLNTSQGLPEVLDLSTYVFTEETDEEIKNRITNYNLVSVTSYPNGNAMFLAGDYEDAVPYLQEAAEAEYGLAMVRLGQCYQSGYGVEQDIKTAIAYYVAAIETNQENARIVLEEWGIISEQELEDIDGITDVGEAGEGLFMTGVSYHLGNGVEKDERKAFKYFKTAAQKGYALAYCYAGCCYMNGIGVGEKNYPKAVEYFMMGNEQGDVNSKLWLGYCYLFGLGVSQNEVRAVEYFRTANQQGDAQALHWIGYCYEYGCGVTQDKDLAATYHEEAKHSLSMVEEYPYEEMIYERPMYNGPLEGDILFWQNRMWENK